jgi:hypothetical protein
MSCVPPDAVVGYVQEMSFLWLPESSSRQSLYNSFDASGWTLGGLSRLRNALSDHSENRRAAPYNVEA